MPRDPSTPLRYAQGDKYDPGFLMRARPPSRGSLAMTELADLATDVPLPNPCLDGPAIICYSVSQDVVHRHYPGRLTTAANVAFAFSQKESSLGPVNEWNIWHLLPLDDPCEPFKIEVREFPARK